MISHTNHGTPSGLVATGVNRAEAGVAVLGFRGCGRSAACARAARWRRGKVLLARLPRKTRRAAVWVWVDGRGNIRAASDTVRDKTINPGGGGSCAADGGAGVVRTETGWRLHADGTAIHLQDHGDGGLVPRRGDAVRVGKALFIFVGGDEAS